MNFNPNRKLGLTLAAALGLVLMSCGESSNQQVTAVASANQDGTASVDGTPTAATDAQAVIDAVPLSDGGPLPDQTTSETTAQPVYTCPIAGSGSGPVVFAAAQKGATAVAVDGQFVYWTANNGVYRRTVAMGPIETLDSSAGSGGPLAVDGEFVFFAHPNLGKVLRVNKTGGSPLELATTSTIAGLAVDATHVWFTVWLDNGMVAKVLRSGGEVVPFAAEQAFPVGVALGNDVLAWTAAGGDGKGTVGKVMYGNKKGIGITPLVSAANGAGPLAMHGGHLYWGQEGSIRSVAIDGSENQTWLTNQGEIRAVAATGTQIMFSVTGLPSGRIGRIDTKDGVLTLLATNQKQPRGVTVAQGCVFWANSGTTPTVGDGSISVRDIAATSAGTPGPCTTPDPSGCYAKGKNFCQPTASGQKTTCTQNNPQDGCLPFSCTCDTATAAWACDASCSGGVCKPVCETAKPTAYCCQGGSYVKPDCDNAVFSCPAAAVSKPFAGCGPFSGSKSAIVTCDKYPCTSGQWCCYSIVPNCTAVTTSCYAIQACEGSHHCAADQACCATGVIDGTYIGTQCKAASACTGTPNWRACADTSDCPTGQNCCTKGKGGKFGLCHSGLCG